MSSKKEHSSEDTPVHGNTEPPSPSGFPEHVLEMRKRAGINVEHQEKFMGLTDEESQKLLWEMMSKPLPKTVTDIQSQFAKHVLCTLARTRYNLNAYGAYQAAAYCARDHLIESWNETQAVFTKKDVKRVYYLSMEFLVGRSLQNALLNMELEPTFREALMELGFKLEDMYDEEVDAALGNGGLGRLAACFMDSLATLDYPAWGYGIRYQFGMFKQYMHNGYQAENPDYWLNFGNPWELERLDVHYPVRFYGSTHVDPKTNRTAWVGGEVVQAVAYDLPIPGFRTYNTINLRLWSSKPSKEFDLASFNEGDYLKAIESKHRSENISMVLYPDDSTYMGKELRLKQQYFFVSATLRDIVRRFKKSHRPLNEFPNKVAIQLNDTHPSITIPELMRILVDEEGLGWDQAWNVTIRTCAFTNHTVLPEALEKWPVDMMTVLLPRHMQIIYDINMQFLQDVEIHYPNDGDRLRRMSIIEEGGVKTVRMAHLAIIGSHSVNGVAELHSFLLKTTIFKDFYEMFKDRFNNKTNGVTPRRWLHQCNPGLDGIITRWLESDEWLTDLSKLRDLNQFAQNPQLQKEWRAVKLMNKVRLAAYIKKECGVVVNPNSLFDIQVKRLHEYKRQLLNILGVIHRYLTIRNATEAERKKMVPHVFVFAGKAAPGYAMAKRILKLITSACDAINTDNSIGDLLKCVFLPNYNVSLAEQIIPASDISEHISTAGTEASGTGNMKFALNGGLIIGTLDGANIEIMEEIGRENIFIFGATKDEVADIRARIACNKPEKTPVGDELQQVIDFVRSGLVGPIANHESVFHSFLNCNDSYILTHDFPAYIAAQKKIDEEWVNQDHWVEMSIHSTAGMGKFSADRTIQQYAREIWRIEPCRLDYPESIENSK